MELVAAYLGDRAKQGYRAASFLEKLRGIGGFALVDELAAKPAVDAAQRHRNTKDTPARIQQNQIATIVGWSLERLSPPARTTLEFASLLMPDEVPLDWLRRLVTQRHPEVGTAELDSDACWPAVWRELHGLRLLHPAGEIEVNEQHLAPLPATVRLHRLIAGHVAFGVPPSGGLPAPRQLKPELQTAFAELDRFLDELTTEFEQQVGQGEDIALRAQHPRLREQLSHLIAAHPPTPSLLRSSQVVADFEGEHGSLSSALDLTARILAAKEAIHAANPESEEAARDVSVSLNKLADFLARRGQAGDGEQALGYYERSLAVREELARANPQSGQAARDLLVSLERLAAFEGGRVGGETKALELQTRSLGLALQLREQNPTAFFYQRTAAVSFFLTCQRAQAAGNQELMRQCLTGCFSVLDPLVQAGVELNPPMRNLHAQLNPMFSPP